MIIKAVENISQLRKRVQRFLSSEAYGKSEIKAALDDFTRYGPVALFGGVLRDLCLVGNEGFASDVDIVVKTDRWAEFVRHLEHYKYSKNKYGGYRIQLSKWSIDLWQLEDTWASKHGYVEVKTFEDLCDTTFFDWDAIGYELQSKKIFAKDDYLERISSGILDINLLPNPNPLGNSIKALRYLEKYDAKLSPRLASYISDVLSELDADEIGEIEKMSHERAVLGKLTTIHLSALKSHQNNEPHLPLKKEKYQKSLDLHYKN
jgi:predicted nucleotidyltransferase